MTEIALIIGAGQGLSAALARRVRSEGLQPLLVARDTSDLAPLVAETEALTYDCDASDPEAMAGLFSHLDTLPGALELAIYNPSARTRGPIAALNPDDVQRALQVTAFGAFLMAHHAAGRMLNRGRGTLLFTGASAGVKGFANSAPFAMGKFALRGLCQSLARELHPQNIHVGHMVVDGGIDGTPQDAANQGKNGDSLLDPNALAEAYWALHVQHRSAWSWELELRPWVERF